MFRFESISIFPCRRSRACYVYYWQGVDIPAVQVVICHATIPYYVGVERTYLRMVVRSSYTVSRRFRLTFSGLDTQSRSSAGGSRLDIVFSTDDGCNDSIAHFIIFRAFGRFIRLGFCPVYTRIVFGSVHRFDVRVFVRGTVWAVGWYCFFSVINGYFRRFSASMATTSGGSFLFVIFAYSSFFYLIMIFTGRGVFTLSTFS